MSDYTPSMGGMREAYHRWATVNDNVVAPSELDAEFDRFIAKVKSDAWGEGLQAGWEECQNPGPFVNDWWDSKLPNPYRIESDS